MAKLVWQESRSTLGVTATIQLWNDNGQLRLSGTGSGYGCSFAFGRDVSGDMDWNGEIGTCGWTKIFLYFQVRNFRRSSNFVSFDLTVWGATQSTGWLPVGGVYFKVQGPLAAVESPAALLAYLTEEHPAALREHGIELGEEVPEERAVAAV